MPSCRTACRTPSHPHPVFPLSRVVVVVGSSSICLVLLVCSARLIRTFLPLHPHGSPRRFWTSRHLVLRYRCVEISFPGLGSGSCFACLPVASPARARPCLPCRSAQANLLQTSNVSIEYYGYDLRYGVGLFLSSLQADQHTGFCWSHGITMTTKARRTGKRQFDFHLNTNYKFRTRNPIAVRYNAPRQSTGTD